MRLGLLLCPWNSLSSRDGWDPEVRGTVTEILWQREVVFWSVPSATLHMCHRGRLSFHHPPVVLSPELLAKMATGFSSSLSLRELWDSTEQLHSGPFSTPGKSLTSPITSIISWKMEEWENTAKMGLEFILFHVNFSVIPWEFSSWPVVWENWGCFYYLSLSTVMLLLLTVHKDVFFFFLK